MRAMNCGFWVMAGFLALSPLAVAEDAAEQPEAGGLFARLDSNHDGQVSRDEVPDEKQRLFDRLLRDADKDGNSQLNADEFAGGLAQAPPEGDRPDRGDRPDGPPGPPREGRGPHGPPPEEVFKHIDSNGDGSISQEEFVQHHKQMMERMRARFGDREGFRPGREGGRPDGPPRDGEGPPRGPRDRGPEGRGPRDGEGPPRGPGDRGPEGRRGPGFGNPEEFFSHLDKNGDGKVTADEVPEQGKERFAKMMERNDKDGDQAVSKEEFLAGVRERMERMKERHGRPDGPEGRRRPGPPEGGPRDGGPPEGPPPGDRPGENEDVLYEGRPESGRFSIRAMFVADERRADGPPPGGPRRDRGPDAGPPRGPHPDGPPHHRRPEGRGPHAGGRPQGPPPMAPFAIFRLLNSDGDGKLSEAELKNAAEKLMSLDKDKDGSVSAREMYAFTSRGRGEAGRPQGPPLGRPSWHEGPPRHRQDWRHGPPHAGRGPRSMGELAGREHWDRGGRGPGDARSHHGHRGGKHAHGGKCKGGKCHGGKCHGDKCHGDKCHGKYGEKGKHEKRCPHCRQAMPRKDGSAGKKCHGKKCHGKKHGHDGKCKDGKCQRGEGHGGKGHGKKGDCKKCDRKKGAAHHGGKKQAGDRMGHGRPSGSAHRGGPHGGFGPMPSFNPGRMMEHMAKAADQDKDGKVSFDEFVAGHKKRFEQLDANKDGTIDEAERKAAAEKMAEGMKQAREKMMQRMKEMRKQQGEPAKKPAEEKKEASIEESAEFMV